VVITSLHAGEEVSKNIPAFSLHNSNRIPHPRTDHLPETPPTTNNTMHTIADRPKVNGAHEGKILVPGSHSFSSLEEGKPCAGDEGMYLKVAQPCLAESVAFRAY